MITTVSLWNLSTHYNRGNRDRKHFNRDITRRSLCSERKRKKILGSEKLLLLNKSKIRDHTSNIVNHKNSNCEASASQMKPVTLLSRSSFLQHQIVLGPDILHTLACPGHQQLLEIWVKRVRERILTVYIDQVVLYFMFSIRHVK